jgi:hypothetical protein
MRTHYLNKASSFYWRGPDLSDLIKRTASIAEKVHAEVLRNEFPPTLLAPGARQLPKTPIVLIGHSRGGAAVVMVARMLAEKKIPVDAMFLFDAVSRQSRSSIDVDKVPGTVRVCRHAVRNEGAQVVMEVEERQLWRKVEKTPGYLEMAKQFARVGSGTFEDFLMMGSPHLSARFPELARAVTSWRTKAQSLKGIKVAMRNSFEAGASGFSIPFGNCARSGDAPCDYKEEPFAGSHGAMGGVPWRDLGDEIKRMDEDVANRVWTWMSGHMLQQGVKAGGK